MHLKNTLKWQVANQIKKWRMKKKLTQEILAEKAGFHYKYYQKVEAGTVNLTLDSIERIAIALSTRPKNFFK
ncbi:MAG: helix-turn-helix transcriptional regulator [Deltaproteobacteria bacterium]|nr:helix-turn-helix transcriptional regulator [Deltaproteobacteria bacterium]